MRPLATGLRYGCSTFVSLVTAGGKDGLEEQVVIEDL